MENETIFGLLTVAATDIALPLSSLREVVPCPDTFDSMPVGSEVFIGAMELRGVVVPVVDIRKFIRDQEATESRNDVVVVMNDGAHVVGLLADGLRGIAQIPARDITAVTSRDGSLLFSETFVHPEHNSVVSVLQIEAILRLPGVPLVVDRLGAGALASSEGSTVASVGHRHTLVRSGPTLLAFDIESVHTLLPDCRPRQSVLSSEVCLGVVEFDGREVPVLDPLQLFGLGVLPQDHLGPGVVVKFDDGYVVLALTALLELRDIDLTSTKPLPAFVTPRPHYFRGLSEVGADLCFVVDHAQLMCEQELLTHASVNTALSAAAQSSQESEFDHVQAARDAAAQLTYSIGFEAATPLEQIEEILPLPETVSVTNGHTFVLGAMSHRGSIVPIISLRLILGLEAADDPESSCLLLVKSDGGHVAVAVDGLKSIDSLVWQDPDEVWDGPAGPQDFAQVLERSPLVNVSSHKNLVPALDLRKLVSALSAPEKDSPPYD